MPDLAKAKQLLEKLNNGSDVSLRDFEAALGKDGLAEYDDFWQIELDNRKLFEKKPYEIKHYEELVHAGDFDENRADGIKGFGKRSAVTLRNLSETKYERAIEYLSEIISIDGNLRIWFDRDLDFGVNTTTLSIDRVGVPRTVTSRSHYKLSDGMAQKRSKADVKRDVLKSAIHWMENPTSVAATEEHAAILNQKLAAFMGKR